MEHCSDCYHDNRQRNSLLNSRTARADQFLCFCSLLRFQSPAIIMTRKFIKLKHLCVSILFVCSLARPLSLRDAPSEETTDLQGTTNQQTSTADKVLLTGLISAAGIAGVALVALAFAFRRIRKLTKEVMKNNQRDIERQNIAPLCVSPPCETLSSCCQTCNLCKEIGTQSVPIMCEVATQKTARVIAPTEGTFAESIGSVTRVSHRYYTLSAISISSLCEQIILNN